MSHSTTNSTDLSLSDVIVPVCYTRLVLIYDYVINDLEKPLLKFLHHYCRSAFKQILDNKLVDPVERPKIFTRKINRNLSVASLNVEQSDIFPYGRTPDDHSPLFFLHQFTVRDGTLLAIGVHHRLTDGHGLIHLLYRFSIWLSKVQIPFQFEHDRSLIAKRIAPTILYEHREYYIEDSSLFSSAISQSEIETDVIVKRYKKDNLFSKLKITGKHVSFNDVLVAWLTKLISRIRRVPRETIVRVGMPTNGRPVLRLEEDYFGNCVFYIYIPFLMSDLQSMSVNDLSERVHEERKRCMTRAYIESALAYIKYNTAKPNHRVCPIFNLFGEYDLTFTNWSRFPMYQIDFGRGPPRRVFLPPGNRRNGMITILPTSEEDNEIELYIRLDKRYIVELSKTLSTYEIQKQAVA
ncbi:unnamed protein product [Adineta ricciae]|uniref:Uncharacterized protein n=1 Tax=Adineta ricciae TaxID=249248 RepID=A0A813UPD3_ADIRI|nr:unnamed protein product [Adineta ricciae]CAF0977541.1 unnamed protein product [Adineta ricciae]